MVVRYTTDIYTEYTWASVLLRNQTNCSKPFIFFATMLLYTRFFKVTKTNDLVTTKSLLLDRLFAFSFYISKTNYLKFTVISLGRTNIALEFVLKYCKIYLIDNSILYTIYLQYKQISKLK